MIAPVRPRIRPRTRRDDFDIYSPVLLVGCGAESDRITDALASAGFGDIVISSSSSRSLFDRNEDPSVVIVGCDEDTRRLGHGVQELRSDFPRAALLFFAGAACLDACGSALDAGADDILLPPHTKEGLGIRTRLVWERICLEGEPAGRPNLPLGPLRIGQLVLDLTHREVTTQDEPVPLTGREFELLVRLIEADGAPVTRARLIRDIWGRGNTTESVLDATVSRLRRKLESSQISPNLLTTVRGVGYRIAV